MATTTIHALIRKDRCKNKQLPSPLFCRHSIALCKCIVHQEQTGSGTAITEAAQPHPRPISRNPSSETHHSREKSHNTRNSIHAPVSRRAIPSATNQETKTSIEWDNSAAHLILTNLIPLITRSPKTATLVSLTRLHKKGKKN
jgi:hypothetical protein